jgi:predicted nicotinamide N-methyase
MQSNKGKFVHDVHKRQGFLSSEENSSQFKISSNLLFTISTGSVYIFIKIKEFSSWQVEVFDTEIRLLSPPYDYSIPVNEVMRGTTGRTVWNATFALLREVEGRFAACPDPTRHDVPSSPQWWHGKRVLDLSAGLGLVGIGLAKLGARVVMTDLGESQIDILKKNVKFNHLTETQVYCQELAWGDEAALQSLLASHGPFDVVIAVDLLYITVRENNPEPLLQTLSTLLKTCKECVLLCFEDRQPVPETDFTTKISAVAGKVVHQDLSCRLLPEDSHLGASVPEAETLFAGISFHEKPKIHLVQLFPQMSAHQEQERMEEDQD